MSRQGAHCTLSGLAYYSLNTFHAYKLTHPGVEKHRWLKAIGFQSAANLDSLYVTTNLDGILKAAAV
ncbi:uncharacterized protein MYCFIDRAFT_181037 [Pseudocercospora fijiensis CIRAD86]|uniref:Uncharacterized protein n=1 Tax=Pseudocercospora fijiensis (strain CIRAD86) TaxID=383855 RepID=N1QA04_PSEFD|nr:uncharacterized protein MYCFIDRAFT_181037 [Pseudocercospora fijiensis CIRAD86]EME87722.1 hypothetical protein MYCFIDRAFT_181037 [Pseudocercospora fijiensis CIRAD86]